MFILLYNICNALRIKNNLESWYIATVSVQEHLNAIDMLTGRNFSALPERVKLTCSISFAQKKHLNSWSNRHELELNGWRNNPLSISCEAEKLCISQHTIKKFYKFLQCIKKFSNFELFIYIHNRISLIFSPFCPVDSRAKTLARPGLARFYARNDCLLFLLIQSAHYISINFLKGFKFHKDD